MSALHLIKKIEKIDENTQVVHFKDQTPSLNIISEGDTFTAVCGKNTLKSMKINPIINAYVKYRVHALNEESREINAGDEVIISHGEHKGKHGHVSIVQNPEGDKKYFIKKSDHEGYGHYSADQFFHKHLSEEASVVGGGAIAGVGVGAQGEPGVRRDHRSVAIKTILDKMLRRKELID